MRLARAGEADEIPRVEREAASRAAREATVWLEEVRSALQTSESGVVESTALLTSLRELQRLSLDLQTALVDFEAARALAPEPGSARDAAREALEALITASDASVHAIARGLLRARVPDEFYHARAELTNLDIHDAEVRVVRRAGSRIAVGNGNVIA